MSETIARLVAAARDAARHAHAPYSGFAVGAAVLLDDGEIIVGTNFENASYGLTLCAETVALASVNAAGKIRQVTALAVTGGKRVDGVMTGSDIVHPCGRCRQVIMEAAQVSGCDIAVHCAAATGSEIRSYTIEELLPHAFGPKEIGVC
jgi:cytidine deaminase